MGMTKPQKKVFDRLQKRLSACHADFVSLQELSEPEAMGITRTELDSAANLAKASLSMLGIWERRKLDGIETRALVARGDGE